MDDTSQPLPNKTTLAEGKKGRPMLGGAHRIDEEHKGEEKDDTPAVTGTFAGVGTAFASPVEASTEGQPGAYKKMNVRQSNGIPRNEICASIKKHMEPLFISWGLKVIELQINRAELADVRYAAEYESSSLTVAKTKADARAQEAKNFVTIASAEAAAAKRMLEVKAEADAQLAMATAQAQAKIILARATAEAAELEADGRNKAAGKMSDPFAKRLMIGEQDVTKARALSNLRSLIVQPNSQLLQSINGGAIGAELPGAVPE